MEDDYRDGLFGFRRGVSVPVHHALQLQTTRHRRGEARSGCLGPVSRNAQGGEGRGTESADGTPTCTSRTARSVLVSPSLFTCASMMIALGRYSPFSRSPQLLQRAREADLAGIAAGVIGNTESEGESGEPKAVGRANGECGR